MRISIAFRDKFSCHETKHAGCLRLRCAALIALCATGLVACAMRDPFVDMANNRMVGNWQIERQADRITGETLPSATVAIRNASNSNVDFPRPAVLQLTCFKSQPIVNFGFGFKIGSDRNSVLGYRFDEKPGHEIETRFVATYTKTVIENKAEIAQFIEELTTSKNLYVRIRSLTAGRSSAEFNVEGAQAAIDAVLPHCPLSTPEAPRGEGKIVASTR